MARALQEAGPVEAAGRPAVVRELVIGLAVFGLYLLVDLSAGPGRADVADRNGRALLGFERRLHLDAETPLNRWLAGHDVLALLANYEYAYSYVLSAFLLLLWLLYRRPDVYRWARSSFVWLNLLAIACFAVLPVAPPRLLADAGFVDTVRAAGTVGSWGSPLVQQANQLAAMPSLHIGWALWVSVVLALIHGGRRSQAVSAVHVIVTALVILATANHYLLDAAGGVLVVVVALWVADRAPGRPGRPRPARVPAADAFFLHVESPTSPQHVGGVVLLDTSARPGGAPSREEVAARIATVLGQLPRFRQRLAASGRWRRPRWEPVEELDWEFHVPLDDLHTPTGAPGGMAAFDALVARIAGTPLPRDRPLWQFRVVHGVDVDRAAVVMVVHHVVADGIGTVLQALQILEPPVPDIQPPRSAPGALRRLAGTVVGVAQLAGDGPARGRFPVAGGSERSFTMTVIPLEAVRDAAHRLGARVSDVVLSSVAGGMARALRGYPGLPARMRVAVPLMVRDPGTAAEGNVTAAVMIDLPLDGMTEHERLAQVARQTVRLRSGSRALASRFVMQDVGGLMPPLVHRWFARTVYGQRFFHGVVSNMPGPDAQLYVTGARIVWAGPLLPLAPGTPLAIGALGWNGSLCVGISTDPLLVPDAGPLGEGIAAALAELRAAAPVPSA
jgi:diacylglycerol O-acyltransferase